MNDVLARATGVTRRYGEVTAVDDVSLDIPAGQVLGVLGPNGAGKSTLINMFVGLRRPTEGTVRLFGHDPRDLKARRRIGVTPQETGLPETVKVGEVYDFVASHFPNPLPKAEVLAQFSLTDLAQRQTGGLSGGQMRRLAVALAFVGRPELVFLDEPTTGLDVEGRHTLWAGIREFNAAGGTVVLTSHYLEEVEQLAERVVVIDHGRIVADDSTDSLRRVSGLHRVTVTVPEVPPLPGIVTVEHVGDRVNLITKDADQLVRDLVASGVAFSGLEIHSGSLEDAFLALTAKKTETVDTTAGTEH
ncbi:ABC transporter ATP-binding protein [Labedaea rhizosphaerae]|uniref:ABC-2 type transport system ATP-binding protein n=1 Tax=Labedaea rhizosphaerae TaxID=598644 RepID=A0A4R6S105_LABRH|nr:ABC transporter ATP-binding protein [Labedaea rhizosphaerae]TDP92884.1 ABC-2 type transport system ATP-binding protein [Labedaea rhizosphaerae]